MRRELHVRFCEGLCQERARGARCCTRDEGGPFGAGLQGQASNSRELLPSNGGGGERSRKRREDIASCVGWRDERKQTTDEASKQIYNWHQNRSAPSLRKERGGNLITGHAVSGVQVA